MSSHSMHVEEQRVVRVERESLFYRSFTERDHLPAEIRLFLNSEKRRIFCRSEVSCGAKKGLSLAAISHADRTGREEVRGQQDFGMGMLCIRCMSITDRETDRAVKAVLISNDEAKGIRTDQEREEEKHPVLGNRTQQKTKETQVKTGCRSW